MLCRICETRKPRRYCPGVGGDICAQCCGEERETTVHCPLDCGYLRAAREHERMPEIDPEKVPNKDIRISEDFLEANRHVVYFVAQGLVMGALSTPGSVDSDVREALESLVRTYKTLESGLYYESRPNNPLAGAIHAAVQQNVQQVRQRLQQTGLPAIRDADVLGSLVFLQRVEMQYDNGKRLGRAFTDFLRRQFPEPETGENPVESSPLIRV